MKLFTISLLVFAAQLCASSNNASAWGAGGPYYRSGSRPGALIGRHIERRDQQRAEEARVRAMQEREGQVVEWRNPDTGSYGRYEVQRIFVSDTYSCRDYVSRYWLYGQRYAEIIQSCWIDGEWQYMSSQNYVEVSAPQPPVIVMPAPRGPLLDGDGRSVCMRNIEREPYRSECLDFVRRHRFDRYALSECATHFRYDVQRVQCINFIADRAYEPGDLNYCFSQSSTWNKVTCLSNEGRQVGMPVPAPVQEPRYDEWDRDSCGACSRY